MLARVPEEKLGWRPHAKSMTLGRLVTHLAELPRWGELILGQSAMDYQGGETRCPNIRSQVELLDRFDNEMAELVDSIRNRSDEELASGWVLRYQEKVLYDLSKEAAIRRLILNHIVHHRGQLSVYLRLLEVPLPQVYGPTADE